MKKIYLLLFCLISTIVFSQSIATYDISLTTIWTAAQHTSVPGSAHWSNLIGATHNIENEFVSIGENASLGIKNVAEFGSNTAITNEINAAISATNADQLLQQGFPFGAQETAAFTNVLVSENFPMITLVSMVAPSPDWFIAVNSENLRSGNTAVNNGWKGTYTIDVFAYDAGTDNGSNYTSANSANTPVPVSMITQAPINSNKMGTITFTYTTSTLSTESFNTIKAVKLFPNPSLGNITIANVLHLKTIEIYNILGSKVKNIVVSSTNNSLELNLTDLSKGVYLVKLNDKNGSSRTQKLVLQ